LFDDLAWRQGAISGRLQRPSSYLDKAEHNKKPHHFGRGYCLMIWRGAKAPFQAAFSDLQATWTWPNITKNPIISDGVIV
jgi:hypothetical protein